MDSGLPTRYTSPDEDSARWLDFPFRGGDIVISTRSKSGTTWMQMICALLIFQTPRLPQPLSKLSPWLDRTTKPLSEVMAQLESQQHRRFIKTHTPMDGIAVDPRATYIVVGRHPLDMAVSLYHQGDNINRERLRELTGVRAPSATRRPRPTLHDWLVDWIDRDESPQESMDDIRGVFWHATDAWSRRNEPNVTLVHYDDLSEDLGGQMRNLARRLAIDVPEAQWPTLIEAATFASMREHVDELAPNTDGVLKDNRAFFRRGRSGAGAEILTAQELDHYERRVASIAESDVTDWLHHS